MLSHSGCARSCGRANLLTAPNGPAADRPPEAALWSSATTRDLRTAILRAVNLGDDADTTAAICGRLAGAHYGAEAIPHDWRRKLAHGTQIEAMADALCDA